MSANSRREEKRGVIERMYLEAQLRVVNLAAGLDELGEADAEDVGGGWGFSRHDGSYNELANGVKELIL